MSTNENALKKRLFSRENIYLAIYSVESYIHDKFLLSDADKKALSLLHDKYNMENINRWIDALKKRINSIIMNGRYIQAKVYFKPKKYEAGRVRFRPMHTTTLKDYIAAVAMLNVLIYEFDSDGIMKKSIFANSISHNFYGNRIAYKADQLFKPWNIQYKKYTTYANEYFKEFHRNGDYEWELALDIKDFFPSIDLLCLYNFLCEKLPVSYTKAERRFACKIIEKLLFVKIQNMNEDERKIYLNRDIVPEKISFAVGLAQGLPQGYVFANLFMTKIEKIYQKHFSGKMLFYVDDSVIFTNSISSVDEANKEIDSVNMEISAYMESLYDKGSEYLSGVVRDFSNEMKANYRLEVYPVTSDMENFNTKSTLTSLSAGSNDEVYIHCIGRETSKTFYDVKTIFSDEEVNILLNKTVSILEILDKELEKLDKDDTNSGVKKSYKDKLIRYKKFFNYRKISLESREQINIEELFKNFTGNISGKEECKVIEEFFQKYNEDILEAIAHMLTDSIQYDGYTKDTFISYLKEINKKLFGWDNTTSSYLHRIYAKNTCQPAHSSQYNTLVQKASNVLDVKNKTDIYRYNSIKDILRKESLYYYLEKFFTKDDIETIKFVLNNTREIYRQCINTWLSFWMRIEVSDEIVLRKCDSSRLKYFELRLLVYLRNKHNNLKLFTFIKDSCMDEKFNTDIDYSLIQVLDIFRVFVKDADKIDNLILVHKYVCDIWKNGSKHLYFYTLHNQDHAIDLIRNSVKIVKAIDYININHLDYYLLFMACYLHDISMVTIPDFNIIKMDCAVNDSLCSEFLRKIKDFDNNRNAKEIKKLLLDAYTKMDSYYENYVRTNHAKDSANEIRNRAELNFIEYAEREIIAEVAEAHGYFIQDVYNIKANSKNKNFHIKFIKILLRLADLLDMCSYRISELVLNHNIDNMEQISRFHWLSHLATVECGINSQYAVDGSCMKQFLHRHTIIEKINVKIKVALPQLCEVEHNRCNSFNLKKVDGNVLNIKCGEKCVSLQCNFLCKWFVAKNKYLVDELAALQLYLDSIPDNYFKPEIGVQIEISDKSILTEKQFSLLQSDVESLYWQRSVGI